MAASATQVGAALGTDRHVCRVVPNPPEVTAGFTAIGITVSVPISHTLGASGFSAAFTAAAAVALAPAAMAPPLPAPASEPFPYPPAKNRKTMNTRTL